MRTLSKRQRKGLREARKCVLCHAPYPADVDRRDLHVFPDGCTAHDACWMNYNEYVHWHSLACGREDDYRQYVESSRTVGRVNG